MTIHKKHLMNKWNYILENLVLTIPLSISKRQSEAFSDRK